MGGRVEPDSAAAVNQQGFYGVAGQAGGEVEAAYVAAGWIEVDQPLVETAHPHGPVAGSHERIDARNSSAESHRDELPVGKAFIKSVAHGVHEHPAGSRVPDGHGVRHLAGTGLYGADFADVVVPVDHMEAEVVDYPYPAFGVLAHGGHIGLEAECPFKHRSVAAQRPALDIVEVADCPESVAAVHEHACELRALTLPPYQLSAFRIVAGISVFEAHPYPAPAVAFHVPDQGCAGLVEESGVVDAVSPVREYLEVAAFLAEPDVPVPVHEDLECISFEIFFRVDPHIAAVGDRMKEHPLPSDSDKYAGTVEFLDENAF